MTEITVPAKPQRTQEKHAQRRSNFYTQTVQENNQRLNNKPQNFDSLLDEIRFIEAELLAQFGVDV